MPENIVSVDEYMNERKNYLREDGILMKASRQSPKTWDPKKRTVDFTMSAEVEDRDRDIIVQAGLNIDRFVGDNPIALPMHSHRSMPIGKWSNVTKNLTGRPKRTDGTLNLTPEGVSAAADEIAAHIDFGTIKACSIGFIPSKLKRRDVPEEKKSEDYYYPGYMIEESELLECSVVNIPANPAALAKSASYGNSYAREMIEEVLDNWTKHPETGLIIPKAEFEEAMKTATNNRTSVVINGPDGNATFEAAADNPGWFKRVGELFSGGNFSTNTVTVPTVVAAPPVEETKAGPDIKELQKAVQDGMRLRELRKRLEKAEKRIVA